LQKKDIEAAKTSLQRALENNSEHIDANFYMALIHLEQGREIRGQEMLSKTLELNPRHIAANMLQAERMLRSRELDNAEAYVRTVLELQPGLSRAHLILGQVGMARQNWELAEKSFKNMQNLEPDNPETYYHLGSVYMAQGNPEQARSLFMEGLSKDPGSQMLLRGIVQTYLARQETQEALSFIESKINEYQDNPVMRSFMYNSRGLILMNAQDYEGAEKALQNAVLDNPDWPAPYQNLVRLHTATGNIEQAIASNEALLKTQPESVPVLMNLGILYQEHDNLDMAKNYYRKALEIDKEFAPAANNLAWILVETGGNLDEALGLAQTAKRLYPDDPAISDTLGWIYVHREAYLSAIAQFQDALRGAPDHPTILYHMAMAQHGYGNDGEARKYLKKAFESEQPFPEREEAEALFETLEE